eukprot:CAMPEP_0176418106 /NCGR_PEP_ID=MMETSP0127-20121128/7271_1 /TAXON_ID=938130 /ORGANISM="Platyophrya macrostoma, Strain WH" /LENGTH=86 /DNA_ID=CAMNT_0017798363 /DNA_START=197 /DNA_END=457 /DNA_ORIENTATION=+
MREPPLQQQGAPQWQELKGTFSVTAQRCGSLKVREIQSQTADLLALSQGTLSETGKPPLVFPRWLAPAIARQCSQRNMLQATYRLD